MDCFMLQMPFHRAGDEEELGSTRFSEEIKLVPNT